MTMAGARDLAPTTREPVSEFEAMGITAFTTTRSAGDFALPGAVEVIDENASRWRALAGSLSGARGALVHAVQVHGVTIAEHERTWTGWRSLDGFDAHLVVAPGAAAVTVADCVPIFVAHDGGAVAIVHAGWRGTAARLLPLAIAAMGRRGLDPAGLAVHFGPAICGRCYEVGPDVFAKLTGWQTARHRHVDLRGLLTEQARMSGVRRVSASASCTRCDNARFFSHRAGDSARQVGVIVSRAQGCVAALP